MTRATVNVLLVTIVAVVGLVASAFGTAGFMNIEAAHVIIFAAWVAAVGGVCTAEAFSSKPVKQTVAMGLITAAVSGVILYKIDRWMVNKKVKESQEKVSPSLQLARQQDVSVAGQLAEKRKTATIDNADPVFIMRRTQKGEAAHCLNPPIKPVLNYWPISYANPAEFCHDYPLVDARIAKPDKQYSLSKEEFDAGVTAHVGDEIYVLVYVNNGVANVGLDRGASTAKNVTIAFRTDTQPGPIHFIEVSAGGDNVETIYGSKKINTSANERLEIVPNSGQVFDHVAKRLLAEKLDIGNNGLKIGNLGPEFSDALFIRYLVRVVT
jgi:hypothetical protein